VGRVGGGEGEFHSPPIFCTQEGGYISHLLSLWSVMNDRQHRGSWVPAPRLPKEVSQECLCLGGPLPLQFLRHRGSKMDM
jgi:hypothetical protein